MAKKESFLLVSLNEDKAKELAQVITNDTCRKILDYLADNDATESNIAKDLNLPISTVHYNLQQLMKGSLVVAEEFHYSEKGKEVLHYKLANKYIIIAPKSTWGLKEKLKKIMPITAMTVVAAFAIEIANRVLTKTVTQSSGISVPEAVKSIKRPLLDDALLTTEGIAISAAETAVQSSVDVVTTSITTSPIWQYAALWFLIGGIFALLLYLIVDFIKRNN